MSKTTESDPRFEVLLQYLKDCRGFDFTGYKRSSLLRRVNKRMADVNVESFGDYIDYLEVHPLEFDQLFNTILINVTSFFRDGEAWDYLKRQIIPLIIADSKNPIRIWSAGCATGQEAYSIAILMCEALGEAQFRERVKIYATDIDEDSLTQARHAQYDERSLQSLPDGLAQKYFSRIDGRFGFRQELRRSIIFGRHDLVQDAPISKLDLLICRNTLMYLNAETQKKILARLHFALKPEGFLFLGRAEMLLSHTNIFEPEDLQSRIFRKVTKNNLRDRLLIAAQANDEGFAASYAEHIKLKATSFEKAHTAQMIIDNKGVVAFVNEKVRNMFGLTAEDVGKPIQDLEVSYRPVDLRSIIDQSVTEHHPIQLAKVARPLAGGSTQYLDIDINSLWVSSTETVGTLISFEDVTNFHRLYTDLVTTHEELETTNEELESTNEELVTTNEELQSTNEELETSNEELQSTNEELETTNAELQSTNQELESINTELRVLTVEVEQMNGFLQSVLASLRYGVIVLDDKNRILVWNQRSEDMWGWRSDEVLDQELFGLDIGLPLDGLKEAMRKCAGDGNQTTELTVSSLNRRGKTFDCAVRISKLRGSSPHGGLVLLLDDRQAM